MGLGTPLTGAANSGRLRPLSIAHIGHSRHALGHIHVSLGTACLLVGGADFDPQVGNLPYLPRLRFGDPSDDLQGPSPFGNAT